MWPSLMAVYPLSKWKDLFPPITEYLFVADGLKSIETNNIQGLSLLKPSYENNMAQAITEVTALSNRAANEMPPGTRRRLYTV
jgi:hypothetical protein